MAKSLHKLLHLGMFLQLIFGFRFGCMDRSVEGAILQSHETKSFLVIYDVACQWSINFWKRVKKSRSLTLTPEDFEILYAVGKFHLGAHIDTCFALFSLNFVEGAAQVDGEVLETIWHILNPVFATARAMSKAHRRETLDAHFNDSNWRKLVKARQ